MKSMQRMFSFWLGLGAVLWIAVPSAEAAAMNSIRNAKGFRTPGKGPIAARNHINTQRSPRRWSRTRSRQSARIGRFVTGRGECEGDGRSSVKAPISAKRRCAAKRMRAAFAGARAGAEGRAGFAGARVGAEGKAGFAGKLPAKVARSAEGWAGAGAEAKAARRRGAATRAAAVVPGGTILSAALSGAGRASRSAPARRVRGKRSARRNWK